MADDELFDQDPDLGGEDEPSDDEAPKKLRRSFERELRKLRREYEEKLKQVEEQTAKRVRRQYEAEKVFGELGVPGAARFWLMSAEDAEPSREAAERFLEELGVRPPAKQAEATQQQPPPLPQQQAPVLPPELQQQAATFHLGAPASAASAQRYTREEWERMFRDPAQRAEAIRAAQEGRVELRNPRAAEVQVEDTAGLFRRT